MEKKDVQEVEAEVIDYDILKEGDYDKWLAGVTDKATQVVAINRLFDVTCVKEYKAAKECRREIRRVAEEITNERKERTRTLKDVLARIQSDTSEALGPLNEADAAFKERIDAFEDAQEAEKMGKLAAYYEEFAPDLVPLVPFERIAEVYGAPDKWHTKAMTLPKCKQSLEKAVQRIANDERTIDNVGYKPEEVKALKAEYFACLSLSQALRTVDAQIKQRERVAQLEESRAERMVPTQEQAPAQPAPTPEQPTPEQPTPEQPASRVYRVEVPEVLARDFVGYLRRLHDTNANVHCKRIG